MLAKRPNRNEDEDDILRQQEEFFRQKGKQLPNNIAEKTTADASSNILHSNNQITNLNNIEIENLNVKITEREYTLNPEYSQRYLAVNKDDSRDKIGFPIPPKLYNEKTQTPSRGLSLYAQKFLKKATVEDEISKKSTTDASSKSIVSGAGLGSENWERDISAIKCENQKRIEGMSREEIETAREEILKKLNPKTVAYLRSKKFRYRSDVVEEQKEKIDAECSANAAIQSEVSGETSSDVSKNLPIPIEDITSKKYVHMNLIEKEKLKWIGDIPSNDRNISVAKEPIDLSARFNFEGDLIDESTYGSTIDVHDGLHHHGEEPSRPGYTINELFMYLQSSFPAQKQIGLSVFEKIITKAYEGIYDECFNANLIEYLLKDTPLALVVRTCLDDTAETVCKSAISALRAIVCNTIYDEMFLDRGYLIFEDYLNFNFQINLLLKPTLDKEVEIDDQMPDQQYLLYDLVGCLLDRTSILTRFAYLIEKYRLNGDDEAAIFAEQIFDILIRFARHSKEAAESILASADLMDALFVQVIDKISLKSHDCRMMHCQAFKLIRVCISSIGKSLVGNDTALPGSLCRFFDRLERISFIDSLNLSLCLNPENLPPDRARISLKTSIESLRTWLQLLNLFSYNRKHVFLHNLHRNFFQMFPALTKLLAFCKSLTPIDVGGSLGSNGSSFDFQFASCVFTLIKMHHNICGSDPDSQTFAGIYCFDLFDIAMRWFTLINADSIVPDFDTSICILTLTEFILKYLSANIDDKFFNLTIDKLFYANEPFNRRLFAQCIANSNAASSRKDELSGVYRDSSNHPSFGSIYFRRSRSVPLFNNDSTICFMYSLIRIASFASSRHKPAIILMPNINCKLLDHIKHYIDLVTPRIVKDFCPNIFDLIEINILSEACRLIRNVAQLHDVPLDVRKSVLKFALLANVPNFGLGKSLLIDRILFDQRLFDSLPKVDSCNSTKQFDCYKQTYQRYSNFDNTYWLFDPLLCKATKTSTDKDDLSKFRIDLEDLIACLRFIELVYDVFPEHFAQIGINNDIFFLFIQSTFLVDDEHLFNRDVQATLESLLRRLLQSPGGIVCSAQNSIPHYGNSVDFFNKVVTQFENCSYGDPLFCNYLLVFFQQKCSPYFRNHFYSEHSFMIRTLRLSFSQLIVPMENLLFPLETDLQTLEIYLKSLLCEVLVPADSCVLYCVLIHHLNHTLFRESSPIKKQLLEKLDDETNDSNKTKSNKIKNQSSMERLIRSVNMSKNELLKFHLLHYSHFDVDQPAGIACDQAE